MVQVSPVLFSDSSRSHHTHVAVSSYQLPRSLQWAVPDVQLSLLLLFPFPQ